MIRIGAMCRLNSRRRTHPVGSPDLWNITPLGPSYSRWNRGRIPRRGIAARSWANVTVYLPVEVSADLINSTHQTPHTHAATPPSLIGLVRRAERADRLAHVPAARPLGAPLAAPIFEGGWGDGGGSPAPFAP